MTIKCLKIDDKWIKLILEGKKDMELRRTKCNFRGKIALGNIKTKMVEGYAIIYACQKNNIEWLKGHNYRHAVNEFIDEYAKGRIALFSWYLKEVEIEPNPYPYSFSTGSWCKAEKEDKNNKDWK